MFPLAIGVAVPDEHYNMTYTLETGASFLAAIDTVGCIASV